MDIASKVLDVIEVFWNNSRGLSVAEIAQMSHLDTYAVYRILSTLIKRGYLKRTHERGKYFLGSVFLEYSDMVKNANLIRNSAVPVIVELSDLLKQTIILSIWDETYDPISETFLVRGGFLNVTGDGRRGPLHCTPSGKIILANMNDEDFKKYTAGEEFVRHTPNTIMDINILKDQLRVVKQEGCAFDNQEYNIGIMGVASELRNAEGIIVGGVTIIVSSNSRDMYYLKEVTPTLKSYTLQISEELGYRKQSGALV
jgi:IclR family transcriptional regulator, KDG regulon repressor